MVQTVPKILGVMRVFSDPKKNKMLFDGIPERTKSERRLAERVKISKITTPKKVQLIWLSGEDYSFMRLASESRTNFGESNQNQKYKSENTNLSLQILRNKSIFYWTVKVSNWQTAHHSIKCHVMLARRGE